MSEALALAGQSYEIEGTVDRLIEDINNSTFELGVKQVRLAAILLRIQTEGHYRNLGFNSWNEYLGSVKKRVNRSRTQLYAYVQVAHQLLVPLGEEKLGEIGITKGLVLVRGMKASGLFPSDELVEKAADRETTEEELTEAMNDEFKIHPPEGATKWFDLGGFYATEDEKLEVLGAFKTAKKVDPPVSTTLSDSNQLKEVMLRLAREFEGTYAEAVKRGEG